MDKKKRSVHPLVWMFGGFVALLTAADMLAPHRAFSELENKYLRQRPEFSMSALLDGSYIKNYEAYINDQFVQRDSWISLKSFTESLLLKTENNGIVYGKNDRLFDKYMSYSQEQLDKNLGFIEEFAAAQGNVIFSVVPSGYTLLEDDLPVGLKLADQRTPLAEMPELVPSAEWVDTLAALENSGDPESLFYRTDHHWTIKGVSTFYNAYCEKLGLKPADLSSYPLREVENFYGTYFSKCKKVGTPPDTLGFYDIPVESVTVDGEEKNGWYDAGMLDKRDKYGAFLYGNGGVTILKNGDGDRRLLLIKDSYSNALAPILLENYDQIYVVDLRSLPKGLNQLCEEQNFTDILILYSFSNLASDTNLYRLRY